MKLENRFKKFNPLVFGVNEGHAVFRMPNANCLPFGMLPHSGWDYFTASGRRVFSKATFIHFYWL